MSVFALKDSNSLTCSPYDKRVDITLLSILLRILGDMEEAEALVKFIRETEVGLMPMTDTWGKDGRRAPGPVEVVFMSWGIGHVTYLSIPFSRNIQHNWGLFNTP